MTGNAAGHVTPHVLGIEHAPVPGRVDTALTVSLARESVGTAAVGNTAVGVGTLTVGDVPGQRILEDGLVSVADIVIEGLLEEVLERIAVPASVSCDLSAGIGLMELDVARVVDDSLESVAGLLIVLLVVAAAYIDRIVSVGIGLADGLEGNLLTGTVEVLHIGAAGLVTCCIEADGAEGSLSEGPRECVLVVTVAGDGTGAHHVRDDPLEVSDDEVIDGVAGSEAGSGYSGLGGERNVTVVTDHHLVHGGAGHDGLAVQLAELGGSCAVLHVLCESLGLFHCIDDVVGSSNGAVEACVGSTVGLSTVSTDSGTVLIETLGDVALELVAVAFRVTAVVTAGEVQRIEQSVAVESSVSDALPAAIHILHSGLGVAHAGEHEFLIHDTVVLGSEEIGLAGCECQHTCCACDDIENLFHFHFLHRLESHAETCGDGDRPGIVACIVAGSQGRVADLRIET